MAKTRLGIVFAILLPLSIWGADVVLPHLFTAGTPIVADEVNANFTALRDAVNARPGSGARLKLIGLRSADGLSLIAPETLYDSQLDLHCQPSADAVAVVRCLPGLTQTASYAYGGTLYSDSACTQALTTTLYLANFSVCGAGCPDGVAAGDARFGVVSGRVLELAPWTGTYYSHRCSPAGCCAGAEPLATGTEVPSTQFVALTGARF